MDEINHVQYLKPWRLAASSTRETQAPGSSAAFQRRFLHPNEFHMRREIQKHVHDSIANQELAVDRQAGQ